MRDLGKKKSQLRRGKHAVYQWSREKNQDGWWGWRSPLGSGEAELLNSRHEHKGGETKRKPVSAWEAQEDFPQKAISALITL